MRHFKLLIALLIFSFHAISQTSIQLILNGGNQITKVDASDFSFKEILSTDYKDTINFFFSKTNTIDLYNIGCYINNKKRWTQLWLNSGNVSVYAHVDSTTIKIDTVINSPIYNYVKTFNKKYSNFLQPNNRDTTQINKFLLDNLQENIDNPFSLWAGMIYLNLNQNNKNNVYDLKEAFAKQGDKFSWFRLYPEVIERINNILSTEHINVSDFKLINKGNKKSSLLLNTTKNYVLDFWFLGCAPCRKEHKIIKQKIEYLRKNKIEVIGISTDRYSKEWEDYLSKNQYKWENYLEASSPKITEILSINSFPYYIIINSKGDIIGRYNTFSDILKKFKIDE